MMSGIELPRNVRFRPIADIGKGMTEAPMIDKVEQRRNWRTNWLGCIQEFADDETQSRAWLNPHNSNPHFTFVECRCCYFDDLGLSNGYEWALTEDLVSANEVEAVADFHAIAAAYKAPNGNDYDHERILADPKWAKVVAAAKRAQSTLLALIADPSERDALTDPGPFAIAATHRG